ncbi:MAG: carboxymuconolactone decarboxylase family protein [Gammaproteobacteria bacterium]
MGKQLIDDVFAGADDMQLDQQEMYTAYAWCDVFERDGLPRTTRMLINIASLSVLGERDTLKLHVRAALALGCSRAEIREAIMQAGTIGGGVRATLACRAASEALVDGDGSLTK